MKLYLREWREYRALSISELADACGISRMTVSRLEHGKHAPQARTRRTLAKALQLDVTDLSRRPRRVTVRGGGK